MINVPLSRRGFLLGTALTCAAAAAAGCDSGKSEGTAAPVNQEANVKSQQATGDFYRQKFQKKATGK